MFVEGFTYISIENDEPKVILPKSTYLLFVVSNASPSETVDEAPFIYVAVNPPRLSAILVVDDVLKSKLWVGTDVFKLKTLIGDDDP